MISFDVEAMDCACWVSTKLRSLFWLRRSWSTLSVRSSTFLSNRLIILFSSPSETKKKIRTKYMKNKDPRDPTQNKNLRSSRGLLNSFSKLVASIVRGVAAFCRCCGLANALEVRASLVILSLKGRGGDKAFFCVVLFAIFRLIEGGVNCAVSGDSLEREGKMELLSIPLEKVSRSFV